MNLLNEFEPYNLTNFGVRIPHFEVPTEEKIKLKLPIDASNYDFLRALCRVGFNKLIKGKPNEKEYVERLKFELETIKDLDFIDYILVVWDVVNHCNLNKIAVGRGRGSAGSSLILFCVGITKTDPIKYGLFFERFISKTRAQKQVINGISYISGALAPDVDLDICFYRRPEVLKYLEQKYPNRTCKILTFNTFSGKLLIKECGKAIANKSETEMSRVSSLIPKIHGRVTDIEKAYENTKEFKEWCDENKRVFDISLKLRDLIKNSGVHPSGIMISYDELTYEPLQLSSDKEIISSFDMEVCATRNLKLDCLGLRTVSIIDQTCKMVKINEMDIDVDNPFIYEQLYDLKARHAIFQVDADSTYNGLKKIKPKNFEQLAAVISISRPGTLQFIDQYADYCNNNIRKSLHPFFDSILGKTGDILLYQEQLIQCMAKLGFSKEEGETFRKIFSKKLRDKMAEWEQKIYDKCKENNIDEEVGKILWKISDASKEYLFNASHGFSYASLTATTVYLKFKYPREFFTCILNMSKNEPDSLEQISRVHRELHLFDIELLPPDLTKSASEFAIEGKNIRFGLGSVKGVSETTMQKVASMRHNFSNKIEVFEAAKQAGVNIGVLSALIQAGAISSLTDNRAKSVLEAQLWNLFTEKEKRYASLVAESCQYDVIEIVKKLKTMLNDKNKPVISESRMETIRRRFEPFKEIYKQNKAQLQLCNWFYEFKLIGYSYSTTLREIFCEKTRNLISISDVFNEPENAEVKFIGYISEAKSSTSKKGKKYLKVTVADENAQINALLFDSHLDACLSLNNNKFPKENDIVIVRGRKKSEDAVFADLIAVQNAKIYTKFVDIKAEAENAN